MNWHAQHDTIHGFTPLNKWSNFRPVVLGSSGPSPQWGQDKLLQACLPSNPATRAQGSMTAPTTRSSASCFFGNTSRSVVSALRVCQYGHNRSVLGSLSRSPREPKQICGLPPTSVAGATRLHAWHRKLAASNNNSFQTTLSTTTMPAFRARSPEADSPMSFCPCF